MIKIIRQYQWQPRNFQHTCSRNRLVQNNCTLFLKRKCFFYGLENVHDAFSRSTNTMLNTFFTYHNVSNRMGIHFLIRNTCSIACHSYTNDSTGVRRITFNLRILKSNMTTNSVDFKAILVCLAHKLMNMY